MSLEDVLNDVMLQEAKPNAEALLRWQKRYPQYQQELAHFFNSWALQFLREEYPQEVAIDEDKLAAKTVTFVMDYLKRRDGLYPKAASERLKPFDVLILTAVYLLRGQGDDMAITDKVGAMQGDEADLGAVFESLSRLQRNGYIWPWNSDPKTEPDGMSKRYFTVMLSGERALAEARVTSRVVAAALGEFA
jgi:hypothetical protein